MTPEHWWPAEVLDSWLWQLEPGHFRVAFALLGLAAREATVARSPMWGAVEVPVGGVLTTLDRLAERCGVTKAIVRRALDRLVAGPGGGAPGMIRLDSNPRGYTLAIIVDPVAFGLRAQPQTDATVRDADANQMAPSSSDHSTVTPPTQLHRDSTAPPPILPSVAGDLAGGAAQGDHSREHSGSTASAQQDLGGVAPGFTGGRGGSTRTSEISDPLLGEQNRTPTLSGPRDVEPKPDGRKPRIAADRIPDRAWKAADYMREQLLAAEPDNVIGKRTWKGTTGHRYQWANEFRLMHEQDGRSFDDIARTIRWLFTGQPADYRFRVESPASLRKKWGAIQDARKRQATPPQTKQAGPAPAPLKDWTRP